MTTLLATIFLMSMVFATGAVEADQYFIAFGCTLIGILSGIGTIVMQQKDNNKKTQLYYEDK